MKVPSWDTVVVNTGAEVDLVVAFEAIEDKVAGSTLGRELVSVIRSNTGREDDDSSDEVELACVAGSNFESPPTSDDDEASTKAKKGRTKSRRLRPTSLSALSKDASEYDKELFSTLKQLIKGPYASFLDTSKRRRFTVGMTVLWSKVGPTSVTSISHLEKSASLKFEFDAEKLKLDTNAARTLLKRANVTVDEMLLMQFSKTEIPETIRFLVIDDVAKGELENTNFSDLVSKYTDAISGVYVWGFSSPSKQCDSPCKTLHQVWP